MREVKFRAKRVDNGEWVEGFYSQFHNRPVIDEPNSHQIFQLLKEDDEPIIIGKTSIGGLWHIIDENTLGEFTGKYDYNGIPIYEGDIVQYRPKNCNGDYIKKDFRRCMVTVFEDGCFRYKFLDKFNRVYRDDFDNYYKSIKKQTDGKKEFGDYTEVIGNIYDGIRDDKIDGAWFN